MARKSRKSKKTYDTKQKQSQVQKVIVNIGEKKKSKKKRRARRPREPSAEAQEYAQAISQIIPKIQYNFPQHSSFNYDAYQTPNLVQQSTPNDVSQKQDSASLGKTIPILQSVKADQKENLAQQVDKGFTAKSKFKDEDFVVRKPEPNELPLKKPEPSSTMGRTLPINHPDRIPDLTQGLKAFEKNEEGSLVNSYKQELKEEAENREEAKKHIQDEKKKLARVKKPSQKIIIEELESRGLDNTPENRKLVVDLYLSGRKEKTATEMRRERIRNLEMINKELERKGTVSRMKSRPVPIMETEAKPSVPLLEEKKVVSLADYQNKAQEISKLEKQVRIGETKKVKKPSALSIAKSAASTVGGLALDVGKEIGKTVIETAVKSVF